ncbi:hypothetical protein [Photobacterium sanguinicancri]|uniref:hypothetical protein n=1 Tax=Photobacterium sanguinicancri TaxID=875932 RepID=UPI00247FD7A6|nr:hypothetical protein [Photobacterium sanguinicancri]
MNDINVEAHEALKEARGVLNQCEDSLEKSRQMNDLLLSQNRRLMLAFTNLLPKKIRFDLATEGDALEQLKFNNETMLEVTRKREVFDIVHAINVLAMANTDVIYIFTRYSGHVNVFHIDANPVNSKYVDDQDKLLVSQCVYLKHDDALEKLLSIESQLTELIIEAREEAEAKAAVEA